MNKLLNAIFFATSVGFLYVGGGVAAAQTVAGDYSRGYAGSASSEQQSIRNAFDNGYRAGEAAEARFYDQSGSRRSYDSGYQAGLAEGGKASEEAYNEGYQDRAQQDDTLPPRTSSDNLNDEYQAHTDSEFP